VHETSDVILILAGLTIAFGDEPVPNIQATTLDKLAARLGLGLDGEHLPARMRLLNLTQQLRRFHTALAYLPDGRGTRRLRVRAQIGANRGRELK
jgi:hypothetical protein